MINIKDILNTVVPKPLTWKTQLLAEWHDIVSHFKTAITLEKIYEDALILGVDNSSWMQELYLLSPLLIATINARLDQPRIRKLHFKLISKYKKKEYQPITKVKQNGNNDQLLKKEKEALNQINDELLRISLQRFLIRCRREN